jgi:hypothetical protein
MFFAKIPRRKFRIKVAEFTGAIMRPIYERNAMFKNREFRVRVVKTDDREPELTDAKFEITMDDITVVALKLIKNSALAVGSVIAVAAVAHAASEIAIHHGTKK